MSLRWRLTFILLLTMLPAAVFSLHEAWSARESEIKRVEANTHRLALVAAAYQRELLDGTRRVLTTLAQIPDVRTSVPEACRATLSRLLERFPEYRDFAMINSRGDVLCSAGPLADIASVADRSWFREARDTNKYTIGEYVTDDMSGVPVLPAALPIIENGEFTGAILATISIDWLRRLMERISMPEAGVVHLLDRNGAILASYPVVIDASALLPETERLEEVLTAVPLPAVLAAEDRSDTRRLYGLAEIEGGDTVVLFSVPHKRALSGVAQQFRSQLAGPMLMWMLAIVAAWLSSEFLIARWIRHLSNTAEAFIQGDLSARPRIPNGPAELRKLAETISIMAERIQAREAQLRGSIKEKEVLLKEIHHRVNNNLQTVTSLLNLQSRRVVDPAARKALDTTQMRVRTLSLVHKHLYEGENLAAVDMNAFIAELCAQLWRIHGVDEAKIRAVIDMPPLDLTPDTAIPLGLVITEAVSNSLKHAFPGARAGRIEITLEQDRSGATLRIADDGVGRSTSGTNAAAEDERLGMTLIRALALQLRGRLLIEGPPGTIIILQFNSPLNQGAPVRRPGASTLP
jgi:two-component sensor histidine kinase